MKKRYLMLFKGQVQGVGFRYTCCQIAGKLDITGYAQNLDNGNVRVEAQGTKEALDSFLKQILNAYNPWIRIDNYSVRDIPLEEFERGFKSLD